jgi:hypothetical protein
MLHNESIRARVALIRGPSVTTGTIAVLDQAEAFLQIVVELSEEAEI